MLTLQKTASRVRAQIRHGRASKDWNLPNAEHAGPRSVQDHESARAEQVQVRTQPGRAKEKSRAMRTLRQCRTREDGGNGLMTTD